MRIRYEPLSFMAQAFVVLKLIFVEANESWTSGTKRLKSSFTEQSPLRRLALKHLLPS